MLLTSSFTLDLNNNSKVDGTFGKLCFKVTSFVKMEQRNKKVNNKWVEGTPDPDLLEDCLAVNQTQLDHIKMIFYVLKVTS